MSSGDPGIKTTVAYADYNGTYVAGNKTATGPYPRTDIGFHMTAGNTGYVPTTSITWPGPTDVTINFDPPATIQFPAEVKMEKWELAPEVELMEKALRKIRESLGRQWAEQLNNAILYGVGPQKKEKKMPKNEERTLYNVFVIDPGGDGAVVATLENVVAQNPAAAEKKAIFELASNPQTAENLTRDLEDYDFLVEDVADFGSIRAKKND